MEDLLLKSVCRRSVQCKNGCGGHKNYASQISLQRAYLTDSLSRCALKFRVLPKLHLQAASNQGMSTALLRQVYSREILESSWGLGFFFFLLKSYLQPCQSVLRNAQNLKMFLHFPPSLSGQICVVISWLFQLRIPSLSSFVSPQ